jgi:hypothetical protein
MKTLRYCSYGICGIAISITKVKKGERICPANYPSGDNAPGREGEVVCEGEATPLTHNVWEKPEEPK